jgi:hypothetical protein
MAFLRHVLFFLSKNVSFQRYDSADFFLKCCSHSWQLYTVILDDYELKKANHVFGWWGGEGLGVNQHVWDSQGLKYPCLFGTFFRITKS